MVVQITTEIGRAMRKQVLRDQRTGTPLEQLIEARQEIERLQRLLDLSRQDVQEKEAEIERLRERRASEEEACDLPRRAIGGSKTHLIGGHPVMTQSQAARLLNVSVATVSRYCTSKWWQSVEEDGRVYVVADQALSRKERQRRQQ